MVTLIAGRLVLGGTAAMTPLLATDLLGNSGENSMTVQQDLPAGTSLEASDAALKFEDVLRGDRRRQGCPGDHRQRPDRVLRAAVLRRLNSTFTVVTEEKANQAKLQDTVRSDLAGVTDAGKITVGSQQGGFGTSSTVDITLKAATTADLQTASDAMVKAMDGVPGAVRGGHQPHRQPACGPGQG